jgi:ribonuclease E
MSRQRLKPSLGESTQIVCPRCTGQGTIRTVESLSLSLVRIIEEEALKSGTVRVDIQVPVDVATYILNEKRQAILDVEKLTGVHVLIVANPTLETPQYKVERVRKSEHDEKDETASYQRAEKDDRHAVELTREKPIQPEKAAVSSISPGRRPTAKAPVAETKTSSPGLLGKIVSIFTGDKEEEKEEKKPAAKQKTARTQRQRSGQSRSRSNRGRSRSRKPDATRAGGQGKKPDSKQQSKQSKAQADKTKDASAKAKDSAQPGGQSGAKSGSQSSRNRRRRSNRPKSNEPKAGDVKNTETGKQQVSEKPAPAKQASASDAKPASTPAQTSAAPQATGSPKGARQENKPSSASKVDKPAAKPASDKPASDKTRAESKPQATQGKAPVSSGDVKAGDKQPTSNENRSVTSAIDD